MTDLCHACGQRMTQTLIKEQGQDWLLYQGDFRDITDIEPGSVDAVISDPPYGSGGFTVKDRTQSAKQKYVSGKASYQATLPDIDGDALHPEVWQKLMTDACQFAKKSLKDRGLLLFFIDWRNKGALQNIIHASGLTLRGTVVWDKSKTARPIKNGFRNQTEYIIWASKGKMPCHEPTVYLPGVFQHTTITNGKVHITQKPKALMKDLMQIVPENGLVLDMFMGSGTTGVAALETQRRIIGCESVPEYFEIATQRCKAVNCEKKP